MSQRDTYLVGGPYRGRRVVVGPDTRSLRFPCPVHSTEETEAEAVYLFREVDGEFHFARYEHKRRTV